MYLFLIHPVQPEQRFIHRKSVCYFINIMRMKTRYIASWILKMFIFTEYLNYHNYKLISWYIFIFYNLTIVFYLNPGQAGSTSSGTSGKLSICQSHHLFSRLYTQHVKWGYQVYFLTCNPTGWLSNGNFLKIKDISDHISEHLCMDIHERYEKMARSWTHNRVC